MVGFRAVPKMLVLFLKFELYVIISYLYNNLHELIKAKVVPLRPYSPY